MPIDPTRIAADIDAIAAFSESPATVGHSRPTFSDPWRLARDYVIGQAAAVGCKHRIDAAGNAHIRPQSIGWDERVWMSGSHIDSVPTGGKYDGVMGVVVPLEVLRHGPVPLELVIWAEEEGTTFGIGMIGSRLAVGRDGPFAGRGDDGYFHQFLNRDGENYFEAGAAHGVRRDDLSAERFEPGRYRGLIEVHAEQGPAMWAEDVPLAVVTAIAGRRQYKAKIMGQANHAGSTPMGYRSDALVAAARVIVVADEMARRHGPPTVATVGRIDCQPNAVNVIPGTVRFTVDVRSPDAAVLVDCNEQLEQAVFKVGMALNFMTTEEQPPVHLDADLCGRLTRMVGHTTTSGALHDAAILAPLLPTAMLFVASRDGISHNPAEFSRIEDVARAADVLDRLVRE